MTISGLYTKDQNFVTVYTEDTLYTIARNTGDWGCRSIGENLAFGHLLTKELFEELKSECKHTGTFTLKELEDEN